jgi:hypothetical protein
MISDVNGGEAASKAVVNLGRHAVADQEPEWPPGVRKILAEVAGQLSQPIARGVGGDAQDMDGPGGVLDDEEHVQPVAG